MVEYVDIKKEFSKQLKFTITKKEFLKKSFMLFLIYALTLQTVAQYVIEFEKIYLFLSILDLSLCWLISNFYFKDVEFYNNYIEENKK